jgi:hypothetical protein
MKLPINLQDSDLNVHKWYLNQLAAFQQELPRRLSGTGQRPSDLLGVLNSIQTGIGTPTSTVCQRDQGTIKTKQKPVTVGDRTTYWIPSPERAPLRNGIDKYSHLLKVPRKRLISHTCPIWRKATACLRFRHLGHYLMEPGDYQDGPVIIIHRSVGLLKSWNRWGRTTDHWRLRCNSGLGRPL